MRMTGGTGIRSFWRSALYLVGLLCCLDGQAVAGALPETINPTQLGKPTFEETWQDFDVGQDQFATGRPHRWRTVLGYGGPLNFSNRKGSDTSVFVDPDFRGIENGRMGRQTLGLQPFAFKPGSLIIEARPTPENIRGKLFNKPYMSGVLTTRFSFSQLFGYFEVEAKLPVGKGVWPALWLLPLRGKWPQNGEIDIIEGLGLPNEIWCSVHSAKLTEAQSVQRIRLAFDVSQDWHAYGVAWSAQEIVWYVDRKVVRRLPTPADMKTQPMFLLLSLAVGGSWGGYPDASTKFPVGINIRRVNVWQLPS